MKPKLVVNPENPKDPFYIDRTQLADLDNKIRATFPTATLSEGCKYARWATIPVEIDGFFECDGLFLFLTSMEDGYAPDYYYLGKIFGREMLVMMWMPFFE